MFQARHRSFTRAMVFGGLLSLVAGAAGAQTAPDNTKVNKRDRAEGAITADQQKENAAGSRAGREDPRRPSSMTRSSRPTRTTSRSSSCDGKVTLKGPVRSEAEKTSVAAKATEIAGKENVTNSLTIAPDKARRRRSPRNNARAFAPFLNQEPSHGRQEDVGVRDLSVGQPGRERGAQPPASRLPQRRHLGAGAGPHSTRELGTEAATKAPEGATTGVAAGGALGGTLGLLAGIGALAIPGVGPFIAAGPIVGALAGLGAGGAVGGLVGALVGMGIPEYEAKRYEGRVKDGGVLLSVHTATSDRVKRRQADPRAHGRRGHLVVAAKPAPTSRPAASSLRTPVLLRLPSLERLARRRPYVAAPGLFRSTAAGCRSVGAQERDEVGDVLGIEPELCRAHHQRLLHAPPRPPTLLIGMICVHVAHAPHHQRIALLDQDALDRQPVVGAQLRAVVAGRDVGARC